MLHLYYKWRYQRSQFAESFSLPKQHPKHDFRAHFGSYLSQPDVKGRHFDRFDLPKKRRRWMRVAFTLTLITTLAWLIYESAAAMAIFG
jgi:hypothetical protein